MTRTSTSDGEPLELGASGQELLREKDFAELTGDELRRMRELIARARADAPPASSRAAAPRTRAATGSTCGA